MKEPVKRGHAAAGFVGAALSAAVLALLISFSPPLAAMVFVAILALEAIVALPLYFALRAAGWVNQVTVALSGFAVGALPIAFFMWPLRTWYKGSSSSRNGVDTMIDGVPTPAGWLDFVWVSALFGVFGMIGAAIFWSTVTALQKQEQEAGSPKPTPPVARRRWKRIAVIGAVPALVVALFALPYATKDRSCHNHFRDYSPFGLDAPTITPRANIYVRAGPDDWKALAAVVQAYARDNRLEFLDLSQDEGGYRSFYVSACDDSGIAVSALDSRFPGMAHLDTQRTELSVAVYELRPNPAWPRYTASLVQALEKRWPGATRQETIPRR